MVEPNPDYCSPDLGEPSIIRPKYTECAAPTEVGSVYLHINNGGVVFSVRDVRGPTLGVQATHFGHKTVDMELYVTADDLRALAAMLDAAAKHKYVTKEYCIPASIVKERSCSEGSCGCNS